MFTHNLFSNRHKFTHARRKKKKIGTKIGSKRPKKKRKKKKKKKKIATCKLRCLKQQLSHSATTVERFHEDKSIQDRAFPSIFGKQDVKEWEGFFFFFAGSEMAKVTRTESRGRHASYTEAFSIFFFLPQKIVSSAVQMYLTPTRT